MTSQPRPFGAAAVQPGRPGEVAFAAVEPDQVQIVPANVFDADKDLMVQFPLPGVLPEDIEVECTDRQLVVHAKRRGKEDPREYLAHEWHPGPYRREIDLVVAVDAEHANASFSNGILSISLPKARQTRPGRIHFQRSSPREGHSGH